MKYVVIQELKSSAKINKYLMVYDFFFLLGYLLVTAILSQLIHSHLVLFFYLFSVVVSIIFVSKSKMNPEKYTWQTMYYILIKKRVIYKDKEVKE